MFMPNLIIEMALNDAVEWARKKLNSKFLILDTETTGLGRTDEIIQLTLINQDGLMIFNEYFNPIKYMISEEAFNVHKISNQWIIENGKCFKDYFESIKFIMNQYQNIIIYNKKFDYRLITQSSNYFTEKDLFEGLNVECAMYYYTLFQGNWEEDNLRFRTPKLPGATHDAKDDCLAILNIMKEMAEYDDGQLCLY